MHRKFIIDISLVLAVLFYSGCKKYSLTEYSENLSHHRIQLLTNTQDKLQPKQDTLLDKKEVDSIAIVPTVNITQQLHELLLELK